MKIHGIVYVIIGLAMGIYSKLMGKGELTFFYYVGLLFFAIGAVKLILNYFSNKKNEKVKLVNTSLTKHPYHHAQHGQLRHPQHLQHPAHPMHNGTNYYAHTMHPQVHAIHHPFNHARNQ
jgi:hypothetical protein